MWVVILSVCFEQNNKKTGAQLSQAQVMVEVAVKAGVDAW